MHTALTDRQLRFVYEYLIDQNASAAAARAGYSEKSRASQARDLMNNPAVLERLRFELASLLAEVGCSEVELIRARARAVHFDPGKLFRSGWDVLPLDEVEEETRVALEVSATFGKRGPVLRVRQPCRSKALRAVERVHERLQRRSEAYYAKREREGGGMSLEEIEAMDGGGVEVAAPIPEKTGGLWGLAGGGVRVGCGISGKDGGLLGVTGGRGLNTGVLGRLRLADKTGGLRGWAGWRGLRGGGFYEKHRLFWGCEAAPVMAGQGGREARGEALAA